MQNLSYGYDKFGNFEARKDNLRNLEETFHYDKMNRLTDIYLGRQEMCAEGGEGMKTLGIPTIQ